MHYFFGKGDSADVKIDSEITEKFKSNLKKQFCELCGKNPAVKVAFDKEIKSAFTCPNCELEAVGGKVQKLGPKSLISTDKLCELLTK
jgi:transcription elongation factor Elf1